MPGFSPALKPSASCPMTDHHPMTDPWILGALGFVQFTVIVEVSLVSDHHLSIK